MKPKISIVIPTYNEEKNIKSCLASIFNQDYPHSCLQVIIVDNYSTDRTVEIARQFPVEICFDQTRNSLYLKMIGLRKSKGEYFICLDADCRLIGNDWFNTMLIPHEDEDIVGSFTDIIPDPKDPVISQYFASFSFYSSPLFHFFSHRVENTIVEKKGEFFVCQYNKKNIPPTGGSLYKKRYLIDARIDKEDKFMDLDVLYLLSKKGFNKFAYNRNLGMYHTHIERFGQIFHKRKRNIDRNYLNDIDKRYYTWIDFSNKLEILKIFIWIVYSYSIIFPFLNGIIKTIKNKKALFLLYEPIVTSIETTAVIYSILIHPSKMQLVKKLFS